jgi:hypothetical protein
VDAPRLRPRSEDAANATKVDLAELTPPRDRFLGQAAYLQLTLFENISALVAEAPTIEGKESLSRAAAISLDRYQRLANEIRRTGDPAAVMGPYTTGIDFFQSVTKGRTWHEGLVTSHITAGILDDFFARLAVGLPGADAARVKEIYGADSHEQLLAEQIRLGIAADPSLSSRLAMWGRRLVGDTMLVARSALATEAASAPDESRIEPVFTELIAAHTRRMDALGLTA